MTGVVLEKGKKGILGIVCALKNGQTERKASAARGKVRLRTAALGKTLFTWKNILRDLTLNFLRILGNS
ncbi:hypothetical protein F2P81_018931 [Scophthalmus maximus]|uniref:Uncharacterized protein n=1 Tax=Scophthalmus maximus TaxID=52904 RepID=A0A6A4S3N4_SCOMX|nr:hypothetical protein F2P81_018931 [Scophthalmus maximus]